MRAEANFGRQVTLEALHTTGDVVDEFLQRTLDMVSPNTPEGLLHVEEVKSILAQELDRLEERERQVVSLYYLEEMTLKEIGLILTVTESRISQIHAVAMGKLMKRLKQSLSPELAFSERI
jgi:RNA polymerase sigma factor for flagellar operon FliA